LREGGEDRILRTVGKGKGRDERGREKVAKEEFNLPPCKNSCGHL